LRVAVRDRVPGDGLPGLNGGAQRLPTTRDHTSNL